MRCPYCEGSSKVIDSRPMAEGIRRRRECTDCGRRFTTHERTAPVEIRVGKRGGRGTEPFEAAKIVRVLSRLVHDRRGITSGDLARFARGIEARLLDTGRTTVSSAEIAALLLERLPALDPVAADRFAADYRDESGEIVLDLPEEAEGRKGDGEDQMGLFRG